MLGCPTDWSTALTELPNTPNRIDLAAEIVSAYVANNTVSASDLPALISSVHQALAATAQPTLGEPAIPEQTRAKPAEIKRSITPDHLISFEDGQRYKSLKRHLTKRGLTPAEYRAKWGLPADYPMVAPNYAAQRSELARAMGLGHSRRKAQPAPAPLLAEAPAKGRRKKAA